MFLKAFNYWTAQLVEVTAANAPIVSANAMGCDTIHAVQIVDNNIGGVVTAWDLIVHVSGDNERWSPFAAKDELSQTTGAVVDLGGGFPHVKISVAETVAGMNLDVILIGASTRER